MTIEEAKQVNIGDILMCQTGFKLITDITIDRTSGNPFSFTHELVSGYGKNWGIDRVEYFDAVKITPA
jgi:hypothetical protein